VFDGSAIYANRGDDLCCPLSVYGPIKAAGELVVSTVPRHYIVRTSWVIGDGPNFVRTMLSLAERGANPDVGADQRGRLTFFADLASAIRHLVETNAPYGIYNVTGSGPVTSWADIAGRVFRLADHDPARAADVTTAQYPASETTLPIAPRPRSSALTLDKIRSIGFEPSPADESLVRYVSSLPQSCTG
jgi:dTDP-4-dehydrorhamnose 3,5-epimerase/reductase